MHLADDHQRVQQRIIMGLPGIVPDRGFGEMSTFSGVSVAGVILCLSVLQTQAAGHKQRGERRFYAASHPTTL
jgi:hypothetical protein